MIYHNKILFALLAIFAIASCSAASDLSQAEIQPVFAPKKNISVVARRFNRQVVETVNFGFDKDTLTAQAVTILDTQAIWILRHPNLRFSVFGHTDKVGNNAYNQDLGLRRANRVLNYLVGKGVNRERLEALLSFGEEIPLINTERREQANRRATTAVSGFFTLVRDSNNNRIVLGISTPNPPEPPEPPEPPNPPEPPKKENPNQRLDAGRGNGSETGDPDPAGDPGKSGGRNKGGD